MYQISELMLAKIELDKANHEGFPDNRDRQIGPCSVTPYEDLPSEEKELLSI